MNHDQYFKPTDLEGYLRSALVDHLPLQGTTDEHRALAGAVAKRLVQENPLWLSLVVNKYRATHPPEVEAMVAEVTPALLTYARTDLPQLNDWGTPAYLTR